MKHQIHRIILPLASIVLCICMLTGAVTAADTLITRSYLQTDMALSIFEAVNLRRHITDASENSELVPVLRDQRDDALAKISIDGASDVIADMLSDEIAETYTLPAVNRFRKVTVPYNKKFVAETGCVIRVIYGRVQAQNPGDVASVINISLGQEQRRSWEYVSGAYVIVSEKGPITYIPLYAEATLLVSGNYSIVDNTDYYQTKYTDLADALNTMGLFKGTELGYELDRIAKRDESLVMMLRLLGKETQISQLSDEAIYPFNDVSSWAKKYMSYAYVQGITNGIAADQFGSNLLISPEEYMTFLLRALGYTDSGLFPDFVFTDALGAAVEFGVITANEAEMLKGTVLERDKMVYISYYGLFARMKGSSTRLLDKLIEEGAITQSAAQKAVQGVTRVRP